MLLLIGMVLLLVLVLVLMLVGRLLVGVGERNTANARVSPPPRLQPAQPAMPPAADAAAMLDRLVANRLPKRNGGIILTHLLNHRGRIEIEVTVIRLAEDRYYLVCAAFFEQRLLDHLAREGGSGGADCRRELSPRRLIRPVRRRLPPERRRRRPVQAAVG